MRFLYVWYRDWYKRGMGISAEMRERTERVPPKPPHTVEPYMLPALQFHHCHCEFPHREPRGTAVTGEWQCHVGTPTLPIQAPNGFNPKRIIRRPATVTRAPIEPGHFGSEREGWV